MRKQVSKYIFSFGVLCLLAAAGLWNHAIKDSGDSIRPPTIEVAAESRPTVAMQSAPATASGIPGGVAPVPRSAGAGSRPQEWDRFEQWFQRWSAASGAEKAFLEEEGVALAEERAAVLHKLMQIDPKLAFEMGVPLHEYVALPDSVRAKMETPFNLTTSFDVMREMTTDEKGVCIPGVPRKGEQDTGNGKVVLRSGHDEQAETYSFGARILAYHGKEETTLHGYSLNGRQVLGDNSLQRLAVEDIDAAVSLFGESEFGRSTSPVSGLPADPQIAAVYGGSVHWFASQAELGKAEALLRAIDTSVNPKPITRYFDQMGVAGLSRGSTTELITPDTFQPLVAYSFSSYGRAWTCAKKKVFVAAIRYSQDGWDTSKYVPVLQGITSGVDRFIKDISRGKSEFEVVMPTSAILLDKTQYPNESEALLNKLKDYYQNTMGGTPTDIDIWTSFVETANGSAGIAGRGLAGSWKCWITDCTGQGLWCHEYGHCYGLPHANSWLLNSGVTDPLSTQGTHKEYGDQMDVMGNGTYPQGYWRMQALWTIGWRDEAEYPEVTESGVYNVYRYDYPNMGLAENGAGNALPQGFRVRRSNVSNQLFSVAHRASYSYLPTIGKGLQVVWVKENQSAGWYDTTQSHMLDLTPDTRDNNKDGGLPIGKTFCDNAGGVSITPLAIKGTAPNIYVETEVKFGPFTGNHAPAGLALTVPSTTPARAEVSMSATATDADGDSLAYHWDFGDGTFASTAAAAQTKMYTAGGSYSVKVTVTDKRGGTATSSSNITVSDPIRSLADQTLPSWVGGYLKRLKSIDSSTLYAMGSYGQIYKTTDGNVWNKMTVSGSSGYTFQDAVRNASTIVLLATKDADQSVKLFYSQDEGGTWNSSSPASAASLKRLVWTGNKFIAAAGTASNNYVLVSDTGASWSKVAVSTPATGKWNSIASDGQGTVMMLGSQSGVPIVYSAYSTDNGSTWSTFSSDLNASGEDVAYFKGDFYAGGWNMNVSKVTGSGKVFTAMGTVTETLGGDFFLSANESFALARESKTDTATNLQLSRNGTDWFSVGIAADPYFCGASYFKGYVFLIQMDIDAQGYSNYKVVRTSESVAASFAGSDTPTPPQTNTAPSITTQPTSRTAPAGTSTTFSVSATGSTPLTYQWRKGDTDISGAVSATYTIAAVQDSDAGSYSVVVTNAYGSVTSAAATLTVGPALTPVTITQQPASISVAAGASFTLSVTATGSAPITYQWKKNGSPISGATSASYTVASAQASYAGVYTVTVTNPVGSVTSNSATVAITGPPVITVQPTGGTFAVGASLTLSVTASGTAPFSYQWYKDNVAINGATSSTYTIASLQTANAGSYKVVVTNSAGSVTSSAVSVSVSVAPTITTQPLSLTVRSGGSANFSVVASGTAPFTYQWRKDGVNLVGATSSAYAIASVQASHAGSYSVAVTNAAGSVTSASATLTVQSAVAITSQPVGVTINAGSPLSLSVTATGTGTLSYQWFKDGVAISGATNATYSVASASGANWGTYTVAVTNTLGTVTSNPAVVMISSAPIISLQPANTQIIGGQTGTLTAKVLNAISGTYQWKKAGVALGAAQTLPASAAAMTLSISLPTATDLTEGVYTLVLTNSKGSTTSSGATVTVLFNTPKILSYRFSASMTSEMSLRATTTGPALSVKSAYNNESLQIKVGSNGATTYQWSYLPIGAKAATVISGQTSATLNFASSSVPKGKGVTYILTVTNSTGSVTCKVTIGTFLTPAAGSMTVVAQPLPATVALGKSVSLSVQVAGKPVTYSWYKVSSTGDIDSLSVPSSPVLNIPAAKADTEGSYFMVATDSAGSSVSSSTVAITVLPSGD